MLESLKTNSAISPAKATENLSKSSSATSSADSAEFKNTLDQISAQMQPQGTVPPQASATPQAVANPSVVGNVAAPQASIAPQTAAAVAATGALAAPAALATNANAVANANGAISTLKFSNHAIERMHSRGIFFQPEQMKSIESAVAKAAQKGSKDTLVLAGDNALIVSVKNNTVVTVMDRAAMKDNVFTNIDSTVVV